MKKKFRSATRPRTSAASNPPVMKWLSGDFRQLSTFRFCLPLQFLLLCKLMDVTPRQVITDFMDNLAHGSWKSEGREAAKEKLKEYFIAHGYGVQHYEKDEIHSIFQELNAIGMVFPKNADAALLEMHTTWRDQYHRYWFEKWQRKSKPGPATI